MERDSSMTRIGNIEASHGEGGHSSCSVPVLRTKESPLKAHCPAGAKGLAALRTRNYNVGNDRSGAKEGRLKVGYERKRSE